jgi:parallel beta-helix repeat protein
MRSGLTLIALSALVISPIGAGAQSCPDRTPAAITAPSADSAKCQDAIAKAGGKFTKTKLKELAKCKLKNPAGACPTADVKAKIELAATKVSQSIGKACILDSVQDGLTSSYGDLIDENVISSCTLSQLNVAAELVSWEAHGATTEAWPFFAVGSDDEKARATCVKTISKAATLMVDKAHKNAIKCLKGQITLGTAGNLAPICVGAISGGAFVAPTDPKAPLNQNKLVTKVEGLIAAKCGTATPAVIASIFAFPGATSAAEIGDRITCRGLTAMIDAVDAEYAESGTYVAAGPGALQAAVNAAGIGDKILLGSGNYEEEVLLTQGDISIVGCGGANDNRPRLLAPATQTFGRGIRGFNIDNVTFQSLEAGPDTTCGTPPCPGNHNNDSIFLGGGNNIVFRDIVGNGGRTSKYAVFPILSNNVVVELCTVTDVADAGIYIGQSSTILMRYNDVRGSVAGYELENCGNGIAYGNYGTNNTGGILVFLDGDLPTQISDCHEVHHNVFDNNNTMNYGAGTVAGIPDGTGILIISNDTTPFSYNFARGNNTFGLALVDEAAAGFDVSAVDPTLDYNHVFHNVVTGNGTTPDTTPPNDSPAAGDVLAISFDPGGQNANCLSDNLLTAGIDDGDILLSLVPPNFASSGCATLPVFPGCPAPPITTSTTSTPTTSTTTTTAMSPSGAFID